MPLTKPNATTKAVVQDYVQSIGGKLTLHFLPGYAPDLNPDELVWSHVKRTGTARNPLLKGEQLQDRIEAELLALQRDRHRILPKPPRQIPRPDREKKKNG